MKLTVAGNQIALTEGAVISIERSTPFLNDDTGSFSFPFPVPTLPNQRALGWPGSLERSGDIPDQTFILEDSGLQVFRGEVDYDEITVNEIGIILKSGFTEFTKKMEGKKLGDIDFGSETWPIPNGTEVWQELDHVVDNLNAKLVVWDNANTTNNGKYVVAPFYIQDAPTGSLSPYLVNAQQFQWIKNGGAEYIVGAGGWTELSKWGVLGETDGYGYSEAMYCVQFYVSFVIQKIFESAGYTIAEDMFAESEFNKAIVYGRITQIAMSVHWSEPVSLIPAKDSLKYSELMPEIQILDFLNQVKSMFCLMYEIDELKKEVRIKFKKDIFLPDNLDGMKINELAGWTHKEQKALKGFALRYTSQDDKLATHTEYPEWIDVVSALPTPTTEDKILCLFSAIGRKRLYMTVKNNGGALEWQEVGRLKQCFVGDGENEIEIDVKIPVQKTWSNGGYSAECPSFTSISKNMDSPYFYYGCNVANRAAYTAISFLAISLYHGRKTFSYRNYPYTSFDQYSLDGTIDTVMSLKPIYLYDNVYLEFLNWQTYRAREFTKYIQLSLLKLLALQWGKRYMINGSVVILDTINYDLPYTGTVEVSGFTA